MFDHLFKFQRLSHSYIHLFPFHMDLRYILSKEIKCYFTSRYFKMITIFKTELTFARMEWSMPINCEMVGSIGFKNPFNTRCNNHFFIIKLLLFPIHCK